MKQYLTVKVIPNAKKTELIAIENDCVKIKIAKAPEDNAANEELIAFLAKALGLKKTDITIIKGKASRLKDIKISGFAQDEARSKLANLLG